MAIGCTGKVKVRHMEKCKLVKLPVVGHANNKDISAQGEKRHPRKLNRVFLGSFPHPP